MCYEAVSPPTMQNMSVSTRPVKLVVTIKTKKRYPAPNKKLEGEKDNYWPFTYSGTVSDEVWKTWSVYPPTSKKGWLNAKAKLGHARYRVDEEGYPYWMVLLTIKEEESNPSRPADLEKGQNFVRHVRETTIKTAAVDPSDPNLERSYGGQRKGKYFIIGPRNVVEDEDVQRRQKRRADVLGGAPPSKRAKIEHKVESERTPSPSPPLSPSSSPDHYAPQIGESPLQYLPVQQMPMQTPQSPMQAPQIPMQMPTPVDLMRFFQMFQSHPNPFLYPQCQLLDPYLWFPQQTPLAYQVPPVSFSSGNAEVADLPFQLLAETPNAGVTDVTMKDSTCDDTLETQHSEWADKCDLLLAHESLEDAEMEPLFPDSSFNLAEQDTLERNVPYSLSLDSSNQLKIGGANPYPSSEWNLYQSNVDHTSWFAESPWTNPQFC